MVSTRGIKAKFFEGEKVLCYEPDPTKAKVLYESKVKDVIIKDNRGRKSIEYLIHFRGWNSSWDRCVCEEFILKDTAENRQFQKDLAEKSKLQFGAYLYRKEHKKHTRKSSDRVGASSEDGSCGSPGMDEDVENRRTSSSDEESSVDEETVPLDITEELKEILENDYFYIKEQNKVHKLPAEPNVVTILELYGKRFAHNQICGVHDKNIRYKNYTNGQKVKPETIQRHINICQEVLDGIRIYFDFSLPDLLLYNGERGQVDTMQAKFVSSNRMKHESLKQELEDQEYAHLPSIEDEEYYMQNENIENISAKPASRRRTLRSYRSIDTNSNGSLHSTDSSITKAGSSNASTLDIINPLVRILPWKAFPDYVYSQRPLPSSLIYGATHLTRLFVKLPELLNATNMPEDKLKLLLSHLDSFIDFLSDNKDWFGDKCYEDQ